MYEMIIGIIFLAMCAVVPSCYRKVRDAYILSFVVKRMHWIKANVNIDFIYSQGYKLVNEKYFLTSEDEKYVKEILGKYFKHMEQLSLRKDIPFRKIFHMISYEEYAMCYLVCYLEKNEGESSPEDGLAEYLSQDKHFCNYSLTDYGYAYYRVLNIAVTYCEENRKIIKYMGNPSGKGTYNIQKILDSRELKYIKY